MSRTSSPEVPPGDEPVGLSDLLGPERLRPEGNELSRDPVPAGPALGVPARQENLRARLRCFYADSGRDAERPDCQGVAVVAYGSIVLCASCKALKSAGRASPRRTAGAELLELASSAEELVLAELCVVRAVARARAAGASWEQVGDAVGISRQAAQQRFGPQIAALPDNAFAKEGSCITRN